MLILLYKSKKHLILSIGHPLKYLETSSFGPEYINNGYLAGSNRPIITGLVVKEFFATVEIKDGLMHSIFNIFNCTNY